MAAPLNETKLALAENMESLGKHLDTDWLFETFRKSITVLSYFILELLRIFHSCFEKKEEKKKLKTTTMW